MNEKNYDKCQTCANCQLCFNNDILGLCYGAYYIPLTSEQQKMGVKCQTCIHNCVCTNNNLLGHCNNTNYAALTDIASYSKAMKFLPAKYPKGFKGKFEQGYNTAVEDCLLRIKEYYEE